MKYLVMECHEGYAVLMDENAGFVNAANLNYTVGQTVTDPVIMSDTPETKRRNTIVLTRFIAAAACLVLILGGGYTYYSRNYKTYSTVLISSDADIKMSLNKKGKVIKLESTNDSGRELLKDYNGKGKDRVTVANELLEIGISKGVISSGDTVEFYISADDQSEFDQLRSEIESEIPKLSLNVSVQDMSDYKDNKDKKPAGTIPAVTAPTAPDVPDGKKPQPPAVPDERPDDKAPAGHEKPNPPVKPELPPAPEADPKANNGTVTPPAPPATPDAPASPEPKDEPAVKTEEHKNIDKDNQNEALPHKIVPGEEDVKLIHRLPVQHTPLMKAPDEAQQVLPVTEEILPIAKEELPIINEELPVPDQQEEAPHIPYLP